MKLEPRVIRAEGQYHQYLEEIERLVARSTNLSPAEIEQLELLSIIVEAYENEKYPLDPPDPIQAIQFRMAERGLKQADLIPYFGTSSRVSEVLGRKRPLTVQMIRAVSVGLGIPTDVLVGLGEAHQSAPREIDWKKFPIAEMMKRGWLETLSTATSVEELVKDYIISAGLHLGRASFRRTLVGEAQSPTTHYALYAWVARVIQRSRSSRKKLGPFRKEELSQAFLRELAQLSRYSQGPVLAVELLEAHGISVVIEPHLRGTHLDGAALQDIDGTPILALTLRFDRLDSFWFTLLHEVVHIWRHLEDVTSAFVDDLNKESEDKREAEANRLSREAFISKLVWRRSSAYLAPSRESVEALAREQKIHPSVVVGRLHKEFGNYALLTDMVGAGEVRKMFRLEKEDSQ